MRDIRNDLRERLAALDGKHADVEADYQFAMKALVDDRSAAIEAIDRERSAIKQLLAIEEVRELSGLSANIERLAPTVPLSDFLIAKIQSVGPLEKDELRAAAEEAGYRDGRAFHTTLMNITNGRRLHRREDGRYALPSLDDISLFGSQERKDRQMQLPN